MYEIKLWQASLINSELKLTFEDASGKITILTFMGISDSILTIINDDNFRKRIRRMLEESYKYKTEDEIKIIY